MRAYKYFDSSLRDKILREGSFRIGTLYDYRKTEAHGAEIGDPKEGKVGAHSRVLSWTSSNPYLHNEHAEKFVQGNAVVFGEGSSIGFGPGGSISFGPNSVSLNNLGLRSELQVQDLYVFSLTKQATPENMRDMNYDACYEIEDLGAFAEALTSSVPSRQVAFGPVNYQPKEMHYELAKRLNPAFLKEPRFSYQSEIRLLWQSVSLPILPIFVTSRLAASLCKEIYF